MPPHIGAANTMFFGLSGRPSEKFLDISGSRKTISLKYSMLMYPDFPNLRKFDIVKYN